jgi:hypothetical protein
MEMADLPMLAPDHGPRPMLDRLRENEVVIGVIAALFCALFVGGLMAWALVRVLRTPFARASRLSFSRREPILPP